MPQTFHIFFALTMLVRATAVAADVYRCPGEDGTYVFTDAPCSDGERNDEGRWVNLEEERRLVREQQRIAAEREAQRLAAEREAKERWEQQQRDERRRWEQHQLEQRERTRAYDQSRSRASAATPKTETLSVSFGECLARKRKVIASLGVNPQDIIPIVNTSVMTMDRICTVDGSVLITCSKLDRKMAVTTSSAHYDVGCR